TLGVVPVGHLGVTGSLLRLADDLLQDGWGLGVLAQVGVGLGAGRLDVAGDDRLRDTALLEAVAQLAGAALGRAGFGRLVAHAGAAGQDPPVVRGGIDRVVDG